MDVERKLASVQKVESVAPIAGADRIEQIRVMGWNLVAKKGEFQPGSKCIFFEIDAKLPDGPAWSEFMRQRKFRVKTVMFRGMLSQGLALSMSIVDQTIDEMEIGLDVTEMLGVRKYVVPQTDSAEFIGPMPGMIRRTDELRIQSVLPLLNDMLSQPYYITEKIDGTSCTVTSLNGEVMVCSRRDVVRDGSNVYWAAARRLGLVDKVPDGFAIQGEVCGPGVQKNCLGIDDYDIRVFDIYDIRAGKYLSWSDVQRMCAEMSLRTVRELYAGDCFTYTLDGLLELAKGFYEGTKNRREGIVVRSNAQYSNADLNLDRISFKVLNNDFLLNDEE